MLILRTKYPCFFILQIDAEPIKLDKGGYVCPFCYKEISDKAHIKRHIATHTGEKPYVCNLCDYSAVQKSTLKRHFQAKHCKNNEVVWKSKNKFLEILEILLKYSCFSSCRVMQNLLNLTMEVMVVLSVSKKFLTRVTSRDTLWFIQG